MCLTELLGFRSLNDSGLLRTFKKVAAESKDVCDVARRAHHLQAVSTLRHREHRSAEGDFLCRPGKNGCLDRALGVRDRMAVNWELVDLPELWSALREVEWNKPPRGVFDFLPLAATGWSVPGSQKKWSSRVKCNTYYYRTDYLIGFFVIELAALLTKPSTLFSLGWCTFILLCLNDTFARSVSNHGLKLARRINPDLAVRMRAQAAADYKPGVQGPGSAPIKILGIPRMAFVAGGLLVGTVWVWWSRALLRLSMATLLSGLFVAAHASFRKQNLKAKFESAKGQFKAMWQEAAVDYNL